MPTPSPQHEKKPYTLPQNQRPSRAAQSLFQQFAAETNPAQNPEGQQPSEFPSAYDEMVRDTIASLTAFGL